MVRIDSVLRSVKDLGAFKLIGVLAGVLAVLAGFIWLVTHTSEINQYSPLFVDLSYNDSNIIIQDLDQREIPYQLRSNGATILVAPDMVTKLRMEYAGQGLPHSGSISGYEIFDKTEGIGVSNFVQNVNLLRALEGELARTISSFQNIQKARVHLVLPKRELFQREQPKPSASVVISPRGSKPLSKEQINAISYLVANAVRGLDPANITIVDVQGRSLKLGAPNEEESAYFASNAQEYKINYETRLKTIIEALLEQSLGPGRGIASVSADVNFDRIITNSEIYDPDGKVQRSVQVIEEKEASSEKEGTQDVTVANNLPGGGGGGGGSNSSLNTQRTDETTNFEISKTIKNHITEVGKVNKLSIAVIVDGYYKMNDTTKKLEFRPRPAEELEQIKTIIKSAVGFSEKREDHIEITSMQFVHDLSTLSEPTILDWMKAELPNIAQTLIIAAVVVLVLLLVVRPIALQAFEMTKIDIDQAQKMPETQLEQLLSQTDDQVGAKPQLAGIAGGGGVVRGINISQIEEKLKSSSMKSLNELVDHYPEATLNALRSWLTPDKSKL